MSARLRLDALVRRYEGAERPAVDGLSLDIAPGEVVALVGPSGAGKTTTLRIVAGYDRPDSGHVRVDDEDVTRLPPERRDLAVVFQHGALFPHLGVADNVAFGLDARGVPRAERRRRVGAALDAVGLDGAGGRDVRSLSGGEQQRVALARALVVDPRVLLLDEPLSSLDPELRRLMRDVIRHSVRRGRHTTVLVTHDQDDAFAVADRVALVERGRLLQVGTPEDLYDRPASRRVAEFVGRASLLPAEREGAVAYVTVAEVTQPARAVVPTDMGVGWLAVLRPESLALDDPSAAGVWPGVVRVVRFAGGASVGRVALSDGREVELMLSGRRVREGERVGVRVTDVPVALVGAE